MGRGEPTGGGNAASDGRTEFAYNGSNQRVKIVEKTNGSVTSTKQFVWCPGEAQPCEERDGGNTVTRRFYAQGEQIGGSNYFYSRDHLGSVREMTDGAGTIRARYDYDPYGRLTKVSGDLDSDFTYAGYYNHAASGLYLTLYRAYSADLGRWLSRDPIGEAGGINLYGYVGNDPINGNDPLGLFTAAFAESWIRAIRSGQAEMESSGTGASSILWNTAVGSLADLGAGIPDILRFGDAIGSIYDNPCADAGDWALAGLQDGLRGVSIASAAGASLGRLAGVAKSAGRELSYAEKVRERALTDPRNHNFPYSFDNEILATKPIPKQNGYNMFQKAGSRGGNEGIYEIGVTKNGVIDHRVFKQP